ncbi:hypothetical protein S1OALGB6SA_843 [Olavius algarvensis spirochete endosymbiont]|uniref:hypothetical protein n=1 Tax=Olavius algarvensis spirochete endosymbiont TaxID=260710 RepID=UPI000F1B3476|nr:hypothetical protein [Olavius algarvensis spirochete endosymbiont]VDA99770.1 hypothetical protein S1OALGB6SA_843 [Olavius algarvensis spirochete endosymbiont]
MTGSSWHHTDFYCSDSESSISQYGTKIDFWYAQYITRRYLLTLIFFRDSIKFLSLGKKFNHIKIVDNNRVSVTNPCRLFLRNLPIIVFPVDMLVLLFTGKSIVLRLKQELYLSPQAGPLSLGLKARPVRRPFFRAGIF